MEVALGARNAIVVICLKMTAGTPVLLSRQQIAIGVVYSIHPVCLCSDHRVVDTINGAC